MATTYPYAGGWNGAFEAVTSAATRDVGTGPNRRAVALATYRGGAPTFPVPTTLTIGSDSVAASGPTFTDSLGNKWQLYISASDLTVTGPQVCTQSFSGGGGGPSGTALVGLIVIQGDAALTIANILALLEQSTGGGGGSNSRAVTSSAGQTVIRMAVEFGGATGAADSPATLITSSQSGKFFFKGTASGSSTVMSATWGAFAEFVGTGFTVSEAGAAPVITGPSGAAGAASSTANLAEVATTGPTFTTDIALGGGYPTLTGADAASFAITALSSTSWRVDPVTPFNFESLPHSNPFNVTFNASASVSQTCAITITNVNEAPGFSGTISVPGLTESVAMSAINAALLFSDPDSGDTGTYSAVGTFPTGVTVSSGGLISGTPGAGTAATYSSLRVRRTDGGGLTADSNVFSITVSASDAPPGVTTQPSNQTVTEGGVATFTAAFSNSPTGFAWEFADAPYSSWSPVVGGSGAATASYTTGALLLANNARRFRCTGTNAFGSTTTNGAAQVTVNAASGLAGFDFHSTVGCRFGAIAGSLVGLAPEVGVSIVIRVYNAATGDRLATLPAAVTNSSGYLPRATHASLVAATSYTLNAVWPDGAVYAFNLAAT